MTDDELIERLRNDAISQDYLNGADALCSEAADRISQLTGQLKEAEWRPIESAPRDGTEFIAWVRTAAGGRVATVEWCDGQWVESYDLAGWMPEYGPTHWKPLPDPPSQRTILSD